ncbi:MAG: 7TM-DISM domain-containing protein [Bacteroidales bacterium]|nr:7TM-DISM domain-containing protein [Bacteroidales bacterium]
MGKSSELYHNLMECPAYIKRGFDITEIQTHPAGNNEWLQFQSPQLRIVSSSLPDMPKRRFLSPRGMPPEEFTIIIPVEINSKTIANLPKSTMPGIYLAYIGENWEIYINGELVQSAMHTTKRNWRDVYFPIDKDILIPGTNILAFRIAGDPTYVATGFYYSSSYYIDDYSVIKKRNQNILLMLLCGIFGFTGACYLFIFLSIRKKDDIHNLYYSVFSFLLCIYSFMRTGIVNSIIPNSDISIRLEFISLFMMIPILSLFIESMVWRKITKSSIVYLILCSILSVTQIFFSNQYGNDVLRIWGVTVVIYFSYVFFYNVVFSHYLMRQENKKQNKFDSKIVETFSINMLVGSVLVYICGIIDLFDTLFFHHSFGLFYTVTLCFTLEWQLHCPSA